MKSYGICLIDQIKPWITNLSWRTSDLISFLLDLLTIVLISVIKLWTFVCLPVLKSICFRQSAPQLMCTKYGVCECNAEAAPLKCGTVDISLFYSILRAAHFHVNIHVKCMLSQLNLHYSCILAVMIWLKLHLLQKHLLSKKRAVFFMHLP